MNYKKMFLFINLLLVSSANSCMDPKTQQDLNNRFVAAAKNGNFEEVQKLFAQGIR